MVLVRFEIFCVTYIIDKHFPDNNLYFHIDSDVTYTIRFAIHDWLEKIIFKERVKLRLILKKV